VNERSAAAPDRSSRRGGVRVEEVAMKVLVEQLMTRDCRACGPDESLASAALRMWDADCGILPVVDGGKVIGVITDRDICMALALKGARPNERSVGEVASATLWSCAPGDEVADALATMGRHRIRRLPVVEGGRLVGILSLNDVVATASESAELGRPFLAALASICARRDLPTAA
jgi:CBS domain-containing protein